MSLFFCVFTEKGHKTQYRFLPAVHDTPVCIVMDLDHRSVFTNNKRHLLN
jgi:hypothetical protein